MFRFLAWANGWLFMSLDDWVFNTIVSFLCVFSCPWMIKCLRTLKWNGPNFVSRLNWFSPPVLELLYLGLHCCSSYVSLNQILVKMVSWNDIQF
jgi:hypothetical protein